MVQQVTKYIDITRTFLPLDPNSFPETMHDTGREDDPEKRMPVHAFDGFNFLPTGYGYKSYFGINSELGIDALSSRVDEIFVFQNQLLQNIIYALAEDGIWHKDGTSAGAWTHDVTLTIPAVGTHKEWTWCVIENQVFFYRQGEPTFWRITNLPVYWKSPESSPSGVGVSTSAVGGTLPAGTYKYRVAYKDANGALSPESEEVSVTTTGATSSNTITWTMVSGATGYRIYRMTGLTSAVYFDDDAVDGSFVDTGAAGTTVNLPDLTVNAVRYAAWTIHAVAPSFLNMTGQIGIFRAGARLGFWDSENSLSWSSLDDFSDLTPSVSTLAGNAKFNDVHGQVTTIKGHGQGFIVYATKSIVYVERNVAGTMLWNSLPLLKDNGIAYPKQVASASPDTRHFAFTPLGIVEIQNAKLEYIVPEIFDFFKESNAPIYLKLLEGRYLFFEIIDSEILYGKVQFFFQELPSDTITAFGTFTDVQTALTDVKAWMLANKGIADPFI